jgi:D-3-phosphoglycerate dehydrogenase
LLAEAGVNIATFNLGRVSAGDDAIALVGVDQAPSEALLTKIQGLPHVKEARALRF